MNSTGVPGIHLQKTVGKSHEVDTVSLGIPRSLAERISETTEINIGDSIISQGDKDVVGIEPGDEKNELETEINKTVASTNEGSIESVESRECINGTTSNTIQLVRSSKRSSSSSNDLLYERDRFRARLQIFNSGDNNDGRNRSESIATECVVCDGIGSKTTKLNLISETITEFKSPLDVEMMYYSELSLCDEFSKVMNIRKVDNAQLKSIFNWYFSSPLPETKEVFPWLHGLNTDNYAQKQFFLYQQQKALGTPKVVKPRHARFIMCVGPSFGGVVLKNSVQLHEILQPVDISKSEVKKMVYEIIDSIFSEATMAFKDTIVDDCIHTGHLPVFLNLDPDRGVSLRNFHIQVAKSAICSDFIVYGENYQQYARLLWVAQRFEALQNDEGIKYHLFVASDLDYNDLDLFTIKSNETVFENKKTQLSIKSFKSNCLSVWDTDYQIKEKIETTKMSSASKINKNVWIGNIWDYQIMLSYFEDSSIRIHKSDKINLFCDPTNSITTQANQNSNNIFDYLSFPKANWRLFIYCHNDADFPDLSTLGSLLFKFAISKHRSEGTEHYMLEFPPSGSIGIGDCKQENLISIVNTCKLLYLISSSSSNDDDVLSSLIYCSDGYTESSLLVLCYIMYSKNIKLDEAMLQLHLTYGRPFYIFGSDVTILKKLEVLMRKLSPLKLGDSIIWSDLETLSDNDFNEILLSSTGSKFPPFSKKIRLGYVNTDSDSDTSESDSDIDTVSVDWVKEVEGSLPSRILPYLYLGSLKHANNLTLLSKLGIRKVISVGEQLDWISGYKFQKNNDIAVEEIDNGSIEIFNIEPNNDGPRTYSVESVMKVNNLQDDGIDELSASLPSILNYIDEVYKNTDGDGKILIHCRVGVSRSVTVVIAEVMRRLNLSLAKAYLYVRVRRLNIIIQPNLRFMYELFKWEEQKKLENGYTNKPLREIDWFVMSREIMKLNFPYLNN